MSHGERTRSVLPHMARWDRVVVTMVDVRVVWINRLLGWVGGYCYFMEGWETPTNPLICLFPMCMRNVNLLLGSICYFVAPTTITACPQQHLQE